MVVLLEMAAGIPRRYIEADMRLLYYGDKLDNDK
jgi:hypothetical protein